MSARNSSLVSLLRKAPNMEDVIVEECCFSTPRIIMHRCLASMTTPTPKWIDSTLDGFSNLCCQPLLHLQSPCKHIHQARNLA